MESGNRQLSKMESKSTMIGMGVRLDSRVEWNESIYLYTYLCRDFGNVCEVESWRGVTWHTSIGHHLGAGRTVVNMCMADKD